MVNDPFGLRRKLRHLSAIALTLVGALIISGCNRASTAVGSTATPTPTATFAPTLPPNSQVVYTLIPNSQASPTNPAFYLLNAYDGANGHLRFSHAVTGAIGNLVAMQHFLVIPALLASVDPKTKASGFFLLSYDASGNQVRQIPLGAFVPPQLLAANDTLYVASLSQGVDITAQFSAFDAATGARLWQKPIANATGLETFTIVGQELVGNVHTQTGSLLTAIDRASGAQIWQATTNSSDNTNVVAGGDVVYAVQYAPSSNPTQKVSHALVALAATTGTPRWSKLFTPGAAPGAATQVQIIAADQRAVYCEISSGTSGTNTTTMLTAFAASDGHQLWGVTETASLGISGNGLAAPVTQGTLYGTALGQAASSIGTTPLYVLLAVNVLTGATRWHTPLATAPTTPLIGAGTRLFVALAGPPSTSAASGQGNATIAAFDAATGSPLWQVPAPISSLNQLVTL